MRLTRSPEPTGRRTPGTGIRYLRSMKASARKPKGAAATAPLCCVNCLRLLLDCVPKHTQQKGRQRDKQLLPRQSPTLAYDGIFRLVD